MRVVGFCGASGAGKTTLMEGVIAGLRASGGSVSVVKHTHKDFDVDRAGKDSFRHREAGAFETLIANGYRMAKIRQYDTEQSLDPHRLLAELAPCDWALVEGFRHADLPKVEVWRHGVGRPVLYPEDDRVVAVATDDPALLPVTPTCPVFLLDDPAALVRFLLAQATTFDYPPRISVR
jgi:molybdopterin-guanine dinucleotide biosynthesis protein B